MAAPSTRFCESMERVGVVKILPVVFDLAVFVATLTIADSGRPIVLRTKYILLQRNGGLRIGSETQPHASPLEIILYGRSDDPHEHPMFGRKFIGVDSTAFVDIHGPWKRSWTLLASSLHPGNRLNPMSVPVTLGDRDRRDATVIFSRRVSVNTLAPFDVKRLKLTCHASLPRGGEPQRPPNFLGPPTCAHMA